MNFKKIDISIIVPIYNCEKYLKECINTLLNQTYSNIEIILIDDASTDKSREICLEICKIDSRVKLFFKEKNTGVSDSRNLGIQKAHGNTLMFFDADDIADVFLCEKLLKHYIKDKFQLCIAGIAHNQIKKIKKPENFKVIKIIPGWEKDLLILYKNQLIFSPCAKLYNLEIIKRNNLKFMENISLGEDLIFNLEYLKYCKNITVLNENLYIYRHFHQGSLTQKYDLRKLDWVNIVFFKTLDFSEAFNIKPIMFNLILKKYLKDQICNIEDLYRKNCNINNKTKQNYIKTIINDVLEKKNIVNKKLSFENIIYLLIFRLNNPFILKFIAYIRLGTKKILRG